MAVDGTEEDDDLFLVVDATLGEDEPQPEEDPELSGGAAVLLRLLRESTPEWRAYGMDWDHVHPSAGADTLWVVFNLSDDRARLVLGSVRLEGDRAGWRGAWVSPSLADAPLLADADPGIVAAETFADPLDPEPELRRAVAWLRTQLSSPVIHYVWRRDGDVVAECWRLETTGEELVVSGPRELRDHLASADERSQVRP